MIGFRFVVYLTVFLLYFSNLAMTWENRFKDLDYLIFQIPDEWDKVYEKDFRRAYYRALYRYHYLEERGEHPHKLVIPIKNNTEDACDYTKYIPHEFEDAYVAHASQDCLPLD